MLTASKSAARMVGSLFEGLEEPEITPLEMRQRTDAQRRASGGPQSFVSTRGRSES